MSGSVLFQQTAEIEIDGAPLDIALRRCVGSIIVVQALDAPAVAEISFTVPPEGTRAKFSAGRMVRISVEPKRLLFAGAITGVEQSFAGNGRVEMRLRAHDRLHPLRSRRRFRAIPEGSAASVWQEIASEAGFSVVAPTDGPSRRFAQFGTTDLSFLLDAAASEGLHVTLEDDALHLVSLAGFNEQLDLAWGTELMSAAIEEAGEPVARSSRAYGWDPGKATSFSATVGTARQDEEIELRDFALGTFGSDDAGILLIANRTASSQGAVQSRAQDAMDFAAAAQFVVTGTALGEPKLRPGVRLNLTGLPDNPAVNAVVTQATHTLNGPSGYVTAFTTAPPEPRSPTDAPIVTLGIVTEIEDPEGDGRCRVELPAFDNLDAGFLAVVIAGAGGSKGVAALPDVGDEVVVLFPGGDLAHGLILGGLYGTNKQPRGTTDRSPRSLVIASGGGQSLRLGGRQKALQLSTDRGDLLSFGGGPGRLAVAGDLEISAVGGTITIKAAHIKFEREQ